MGRAIPIPDPQPHDWARFMAKVERRDDGCWEWTGGLFNEGYGMFVFAGKVRRAHRVLYVWLNGDLAEGRNLDHVCHSSNLDCPGGFTCPHRRCVNPAHLESVTVRQNVIERSRGPAARNAAATHCVNGHPWSPANTFRTPEGWRTCRACGRERTRRYNAAQRLKESSGG